MTTPKSNRPFPIALFQLLRTTSAIILLFLLTAVSVSAQVFTILATFGGGNGALPNYMPLVQGTDGNFYGTTEAGGSTSYCPHGCGTVFTVSPDGTLKTIYRFCSQANCADGWKPSGMILGSDGNFYGTVYIGGTSNYGTVFKLTPRGQFTLLHTFNGTDGMEPTNALIQATDGSFYGTTRTTAFKITPAGVFTLLYKFPGNIGDQTPSPLFQAADGNFYGTTESGTIGEGASTIFRLTSRGQFTTLYTLNGTSEGASPDGGIIQTPDGTFYGTTLAGGDNGCGTFYKYSLSGVFIALYSFDSNLCSPSAGLIHAPDNNFYGTAWGIDWLYSAIFSVTPDGVATQLASLDYNTDGQYLSRLLQATNGKFYGTATQDGPTNDGLVFSMDTGLGPFVSLVRSAGRISQTIPVLGQGFNGATGVAFNGQPAAFTVRADTYLTAAVPVGALTGPVTVTTPTGTLTSNQSFRVTPQLLSFSPPSGPVGTVVTITGVSLTQTKAVFFGNRAPASFTVNSDTQVMATVPAAGKTGKISIQTAGGTAMSTSTFTVTQ